MGSSVGRTNPDTAPAVSLANVGHGNLGFDAVSTSNRITTRASMPAMMSSMPFSSGTGRGELGTCLSFYRRSTCTKGIGFKTFLGAPATSTIDLVLLQVAMLHGEVIRRLRIEEICRARLKKLVEDSKIVRNGSKVQIHFGLKDAQNQRLGDTRSRGKLSSRRLPQSPVKR